MTPRNRSLTTHSPEETEQLGQRLGRVLTSESCVALEGALGAGKTKLVTGLVAGLDVPSGVSVSSPTFVLVNEYIGRLHLYHLDAYRLEGDTALGALGFMEMLQVGCAAVVEWADRVVTEMPEDRLSVRLEHSGPRTRHFEIEATGSRAQQVLNAWLPPA